MARYVRMGPDEAEPAIVIIDDWQRRGVGTRLIDALAERAQAEGIHRFEAPVLAYNEDAITLFARLGETRRAHQGREVELSVDLHAPETRAGTAALLKQFAIGAAACSIMSSPYPTTRDARRVPDAGEPGRE